MRIHAFGRQTFGFERETILHFPVVCASYCCSSRLKRGRCEDCARHGKNQTIFCADSCTQTTLMVFVLAITLTLRRCEKICAIFRPLKDGLFVLSQNSSPTSKADQVKHILHMMVP